MKASELRIGNYINDHKTDMSYSVISLSKTLCTYKNQQEFRSPYDLLKPIPLTDEWLQEFGLIDGVFTELEYFSIRQSFANGLYYCLYFENEYTATDIKYVHELQNLYFALVGTELTIQS